MSDHATLISAVLGIVGTVALFAGTYGIEPLPSAKFGGPGLDAWKARIKDKNQRRMIKQGIGLAFLCASFVVQAVAALWPRLI